MIVKEKRMKQRKAKTRQFKDDYSVHSKISYFLGLLTIVIQLYLGLSHVGDLDQVGRTFGTLSIIEAIFCSIGMFLPDILRRGRDAQIYPKYDFRPLSTYTALTFMLALALNITVQVIIQIPLTIRDIEMALAIVFAAPAEELFFRAFLINVFDRVSEEVKEEKVAKRTGIKSIGILLSGTAFGLFSWIFTSLLFALFHVNYYGDVRLMLIVFVGGFIYAVLYWYFRDITGCILAHFALNFFVVFALYGFAGFQFGI